MLKLIQGLVSLSAQMANHIRASRAYDEGLAYQRAKEYARAESLCFGRRQSLAVRTQ